MEAQSAAKAARLSPAEAFAATDLLQYQDGAVVSRILLKHAAGSVTLFAFDRGQGLSEHTSPYDALVLLLDGAAEIRISGKPIQVKAGDVILMPANEPHGLQATTRFKMMLTMMRS